MNGRMTKKKKEKNMFILSKLVIKNSPKTLKKINPKMKIFLCRLVNWSLFFIEIKISRMRS